MGKGNNAFSPEEKLGIFTRRAIPSHDRRWEALRYQSMGFSDSRRQGTNGSALKAKHWETPESQVAECHDTRNEGESPESQVCSPLIVHCASKGVFCHHSPPRQAFPGKVKSSRGAVGEKFLGNVLDICLLNKRFENLRRVGYLITQLVDETLYICKSTEYIFHIFQRIYFASFSLRIPI